MTWFLQKMHLLSWDKICKPKIEGGLGFASLRERNISLLFKWWWKVMKDRNSFWHKFMTNKYGTNFMLGFENLQPNKECSVIIKDIIHSGRSLLVSGRISGSFSWQVGNGLKIYFWEDRWCGHRAFKFEFPRLYALTNFKFSTIDIFVNTWKSVNRQDPILWRRSLRAWELDMVELLNGYIDQLCISTKVDKPVWSHNNSQFTSNECYQSLISSLP